MTERQSDGERHGQTHRETERETQRDRKRQREREINILLAIITKKTFGWIVCLHDKFWRRHDFPPHNLYPKKEFGGFVDTINFDGDTINLDWDMLLIKGRGGYCYEEEIILFRRGSGAEHGPLRQTVAVHRLQELREEGDEEEAADHGVVQVEVLEEKLAACFPTQTLSFRFLEMQTTAKTHGTHKKTAPEKTTCFLNDPRTAQPSCGNACARLGSFLVPPRLWTQWHGHVTPAAWACMDDICGFHDLRCPFDRRRLPV